MEALDNLLRTTKLVTYGIKDKQNRVRIIKALQGKYRALHGIKGTVFLHGHEHANGDVSSIILENIVDPENSTTSDLKDSLNFTLSNLEFQYANSVYKDDISLIQGLVETGEIAYVCTELPKDDVAFILSNIVQWNDHFDNLKQLDFTNDQINEFKLFCFGPIFFLYAQGKLNDTPIVGIEGAVRRDYDNKMQELGQYEEAINLAAFFASNKERESEMAANISTIKGNKLVICGLAHLRGLTELLGKDHRVKKC